MGMIKIKVIHLMQTGEYDLIMQSRLDGELQAIEAVKGQSVFEVTCDNGRMIVIYRSI